MEGALFAAGEAITLVQTNHVTLGNAKTALKDALSSAYLGKLFANNYLWSGLGLVLALLLFLAILVAAGDVQPHRRAGRPGRGRPLHASRSSWAAR